MKILHLLRHGKSSWDEPGMDDHERPLAPRGERAARRIGRHLRQTVGPPDIVVCSTARRARDTATIVLETLDAPDAGIPVIHNADLYLCGAQALLDRLRTLPESVTAAMLVGHNPDIHDLALLLTGAGDPGSRHALAARFPTAACATLTFAIATWPALAPGEGTLTAFAQPRKLA
jgi:phosphohistidine phosphatase